METAENIKHTCQYCERQFVRSASLEVHVCEPKRRHSERDEAGVRIGFNGWLRFFEITQGSSRLKTWDDFVASSYYKAFVKFGRYCVNTRVINPQQFMEWLLANNKKIDHWCRDAIYTDYLTAYLRVEPVDDALTRGIEQGIAWAESTGYPAQDYLRHGNVNQICHVIATGRMSPWILYNCASGNELLSRLSPEQLAMIWPYIDSDVWQKKFADYRADQEYVKDILTKAGW